MQHSRTKQCQRLLGHHRPVEPRCGTPTATSTSGSRNTASESTRSMLRPALRSRSGTTGRVADHLRDRADDEPTTVRPPPRLDQHPTELLRCSGRIKHRGQHKHVERFQSPAPRVRHRAQHVRSCSDEALALGPVAMTTCGSRAQSPERIEQHVETFHRLEPSDETVSGRGTPGQVHWRCRGKRRHRRRAEHVDRVHACRACAGIAAHRRSACAPWPVAAPIARSTDGARHVRCTLTAEYTTSAA